MPQGSLDCVKYKIQGSASVSGNVSKSLMGNISAIVRALEVYSQYFYLYKLDGFV